MNRFNNDAILPSIPEDYDAKDNLRSDTFFNPDGYELLVDIFYSKKRKKNYTWGYFS